MASSGEAELEVSTIDVQTAKALINSDHLYLDVRTVEEFKKGRVKNSEFLKEVSSACNKDDKLVVGCERGIRSLSAATNMKNAGFKNVNNMGGGYLAWVKHGFLTQKPKEEL
ncbi:hypothetical protein F8388_014108 [Cannabis sativa]|uniref:Rhodanese domain-containing protein n=1 Tax=Cannabis sativa TaxID=3483 RepID=A0A7J6GGI7_CANSA|nr:hypothetical protein G4B88_006635 [Cannabis sativa]KAF4383608.1 hypothetical protein F8388_014108 [Cannabis sativa]